MSSECGRLLASLDVPQGTGTEQRQGSPPCLEDQTRNKLPQPPGLQPTSTLHVRQIRIPVVTLLKWVVMEPSTHTTWVSLPGASLILTPAHTSAEEGAESLSRGYTCGLGRTPEPCRGS